jgi:hypothetical protein
MGRTLLSAAPCYLTPLGISLSAIVFVIGRREGVQLGCNLWVLIADVLSYSYLVVFRNRKLEEDGN